MATSAFHRGRAWASRWTRRSSSGWRAPAIAGAIPCGDTPTGASPSGERSLSGLLLSANIVGAHYVDTPALLIAYITLAFFGNGLASITWSLVSAIAPERLLGLTGGVFNFFGNLSGIAVPIIIGHLARDYGFSAGLI